MNTEVMRELTG